MAPGQREPQAKDEAMTAKTKTYDVAALPTTGAQYRTNSGATGTAQATNYAQAMRTLAAWAKPAGHGPLVHALVHLGWTSGTGARAVCRAASSAAYKAGAEHLTVGEAAAPQVVAVLTALAEAGAPAEMLKVVWDTYTGKA